MFWIIGSPRLYGGAGNSVSATSVYASIDNSPGGNVKGIPIPDIVVPLLKSNMTLWTSKESSGAKNVTLSPGWISTVCGENWLIDKVMFPPPTATLFVVALLGAVVAVVVPLCPSVEAITVCVNNKAGAEIDDAIMAKIIAATTTDPA